MKASATLLSSSFEENSLLSTFKIAAFSTYFQRKPEEALEQSKYCFKVAE
jgi:hypothetical protein